MRSANLWSDAPKVVTCLLAVILLVPWMAHAQESTEVRTYLSSISRLYENLEYERALEQLSNAKRLTRSLEEDVAISLYEGLLLADLGKLDKASTAFKAALFLKPDAKLPVQVSPKVEQLFETLRQQVNPKPPPVPEEHEPEPPMPALEEAWSAPDIVDAQASERPNQLPTTFILRIVARDAYGGPLGFSWEADLGTLELPRITTTTSEVIWKTRTCLPKGRTPTVKATVTNTQGLSTSMIFDVSAAPCVLLHAAGDKHSLRVRPDGMVWARGSNQYGQLGDGSTTNRSTPVRVRTLSGVVAVSAGYVHSLALREDGTVWGWGSNRYGQLGDGSATNRSTPVRVDTLDGVFAASAGGGHSLALRADGTVWAWGKNDSGQLGDGTTTARSTPVRVSTLSDVVAVSAGMHHSLAVRSDGTVWAWGKNDSGQLGDETTTARSTPVQVSALSNVVTVFASYFHSLALRRDGTLWAWGNNRSGQLGDGTTTDRTTPVQARGLSGVASVSAGYYHSLAVREDGSVWAWGGNGSGQRGNGTTADLVTPTQVGD